MTQARTVNGIPVSPGLALGAVHVVRATNQVVPTWSVSREEVDRELSRIEQAIEAASTELERRQRLVAVETNDAEAQIFAVHRMILQDPAAVSEVRAKVAEERINAEAAVEALIKRLERTLSRMEGDSVRDYAADLADPWRDVLHELMQGNRREVLAAGDPVVLAAAELTPQVMTFLERGRLLGVITETGGRYSHGAVLARAFGVPCVVGLPNLLARLEQGMQVSVDGTRGVVQLQPGQADIDDLLARRDSLEARRQALTDEAHLPAETTDGHHLQVMVNVESLRDLDMFESSHTDGLGLVRTEFLYMERPQFPSEDEQFRLYRHALERMAPLPVTLRTLDIGGDKRLSYFQTPEENNPALGWRGLRVSLEWQDLLRVQLRAALRAGAGSGSELRILLPMVSSLEEVTSVRTIFDGVRSSLLEQGHEVDPDVPVGMMVEVPSVLFCLERMIEDVDFVSVGTNDLVQYLLAVDRDNPWVARLYQPYHPAVLRALAKVARIAGEANKPSTVCGDMADDPVAAIILMGMGYRAVSVAPSFFPEIKYSVRNTSLNQARGLAERVLAMSTTADVVREMHAFGERLRKG